MKNKKISRKNDFILNNESLREIHQKLFITLTQKAPSRVTRMGESSLVLGQSQTNQTHLIRLT